MGVWGKFAGVLPTSPQIFFGSWVQTYSYSHNVDRRARFLVQIRPKKAILVDGNMLVIIL